MEAITPQAPAAVHGWKDSAGSFCGICPRMKRAASPKVTPFRRAPPIQWLNDMGLKGWGLRLNSGQVQSLSQLQSSQGHWSFLGNWNAIQLLPLPNPASFTPSRYWSQGYSHTQVCLRVGCLGKLRHLSKVRKLMRDQNGIYYRCVSIIPQL